MTRLVFGLVMFSLACGRAPFSTGRITGHARVLGLDDHSGIRVTVRGTGITGETGADGAYLIGGVPAGVRTIDFAYPGYPVRSLEDVVIGTGTNTLADVDLGLGERIVRGSGWQLLSTSADGAFLLLKSERGELYLWRADRDEAELLSSHVNLVGNFSPPVLAGDHGVLFAHELSAELVYYAIDSGTFETVDATTVWHEVVPGTSTVMYRKTDRAAAEQILLVWQPGAGSAVVDRDVARAAISPDGATVLYLRNYDAAARSGEAVLWDVGTRQVLGTRSGAYEFAWGPNSVAAHYLHAWSSSSTTGTASWWRVADDASGTISTNVNRVTWGPSGGLITVESHYNTGVVRLHVAQIATGGTITATTGAGSGSAVISPDEAHVLFIDNYSSSRDLVLWDVAAGSGMTVASGIPSYGYAFDADGDLLLFSDGTAATATRLDGTEVGSGYLDAPLNQLVGVGDSTFLGIYSSYFAVATGAVIVIMSHGLVTWHRIGDGGDLETTLLSAGGTAFIPEISAGQRWTVLGEGSPTTTSVGDVLLADLTDGSVIPVDRGIRLWQMDCWDPYFCDLWSRFQVVTTDSMFFYTLDAVTHPESARNGVYRADFPE